MPQLQIGELPPSTAAADHEVPTEQAGTTYKVDFASIRDWISAAVSAIYDPSGKQVDVYDRANHTGVQALATVTNAMSKTGDTMTGPLILPSAAPTDPNQAVGKAWVEAITGGLGDAPSDNAVYGRMNATWTKALPLTGGVISGTLDTTGKLTVQGGGLAVSAGGANITGGLTVGGAANFGSNTLTVGTVNASASMSATGLSLGSGQINCGPIYATSVIQSTFGYQIAYGGAQLMLGNPSYGWNLLSVNPSNYAFYIGFSGNNFYTFQTDRLAPINSGSPVLGTSSQRWDRVYSVNADSVSSDLKLKKEIRPFTPQEIACAREIFPLLRLFKWQSGSDEKLHAGVIAQDMEELFARHNLTITDYAFYEIDDDMQTVYNDDGSATETATGTQTRSIVYPELLVWMMATLTPGA
jgi:hypothetical protein